MVSRSRVAQAPLHSFLNTMSGNQSVYAKTVQYLLLSCVPFQTLYWIAQPRQNKNLIFTDSL